MVDAQKFTDADKVQALTAQRDDWKARAEKAERERDAWMETCRLEQTAQETFKAERDEARDLVQALSGFFGPPTAAVFAQASVAVKRWESEP